MMGAPVQMDDTQIETLEHEVIDTEMMMQEVQ
jgi:hypothetical protein